MGVYKITELIGTSPKSWEEAARNATIGQAGKSLRDLRVAEVSNMDIALDTSGDIEVFRTKLKVSFKPDGK